MSAVYTIDTVLEVPSHREEFTSFVTGYNLARGGELAPTLDGLLLQEELIPILAETAIFEIKEPGTIIYRLCGSGVVRRVGSDLTGANLVDFVPDESKETLYSDLARMSETPCGNYSRYRNIYSTGREATAESMSLPVISDTGADRFLMVSYHLTEPAPPSQDKLGETQIGADWEESFFIDVGAGTPGPTAFQTAKEVEAGEG